MLERFENIYFVGCGGIGMSALARYFNEQNKNIAGYDRTQTILTDSLIKEGINLHFKDSITSIPHKFLNKENTLVIYTPAIPENNSELLFFKKNNFQIAKRAEALGIISKDVSTIAVAGTHGKTSISSMISHLLHKTKGAGAILGGITKNYNTNYLKKTNELLVVEADEYDRSFLQLSPSAAIISAIDADHLDIYGNLTELKKAFFQFSEKITQNGFLLVNNTISEIFSDKNKQVFRYSLDDDGTDYYAKDINYSGAYQNFTFCKKNEFEIPVSMPVPGLFNVENAVAAIAMAHLHGLNAIDIRSQMKTFLGIRRRMDIQYSDEKITYIDDYAHHPKEIDAVIKSVRNIFPKKRITGIFQPHLFSRTADFSTEFASSLDQLDELIMLDIYPAREEAIPGISSKTILDKMKNPNKKLLSKEQAVEKVSAINSGIILTLGAGDIDKIVPIIKQNLKSGSKNGTF